MKTKILIIIAIFTTYLFWLVIFRVFVSKNIFYVFMLWNLFLALIPVLITQIYYLLNLKTKTKKITTFLFFWIFLLFFPNITYVVTDLMHLPEWYRSFPVWYDNILLFSFAFFAILLSYFSLNYWHKLVYKKYWKIKSWGFITFILLISSYGVFLWRYIRLNSWEILSNPWSLIENIYNTFFMTKMYFFSLNFFIMTLVTYSILYILLEFSILKNEKNNTI